MPSPLSTFLLIALAALQGGAAAAASFTGLGTLRAGNTGTSRALGVSGDGRVAIGSAASVAPILVESFRWTLEEGMVGIGVLPGGTTGRAEGASWDGSVIGGDGTSTPEGCDDPATPLLERCTQGYVWNEGTGMVGTGDLPGALFGSSVFAVSGDGLTAVGAGHSSLSSPRSEAFRWTAAGGIESLGDLPGGVYGSRADGVNHDGSLVVGRSEGPDGREAFVWTQAAGMLGIGDLDGGGFSSHARDLTDDGAVIVGKGTSALGGEAFRWTAETGMVPLGDLPGGAYASEALGVSADGSVVVGWASGPEGDEAFLWTEAGGLRSLRDVLEQDLGLDLGDWQLLIADGISDDGNVVVGTGRNPAGRNEAFVVELPEPSALLARLAVAAALAGLLGRRMH